MDLREAAKLAREEMDYYGLYAWRFEFDRSVRRFGICKHSARTIGLSQQLVALNGKEEVHDTILHEIAHALVGSGVGHGPVWQAKAREIGAKPQRCFDKTVNTPEPPYKAVCKCGTIFKRHRKSSRTYVCRICKDRLEYKIISFDGLKKIYGDKVKV